MPKRYFQKMKGGGNLPPRYIGRHIIHASIGVFISIILIGYWTSYMDVPFLMAPLGTSAIIAFGAANSALAQPRNLLGSYLFATLLGLVFFHMFGYSIIVLAIAGAILLALMQFTHTMHPPAMAVLLVMLNYATTTTSWVLATTTITSILILFLLALLINNVGDNHRYPLYWIGRHK